MEPKVRQNFVQNSSSDSFPRYCRVRLRSFDENITDNWGHTNCIVFQVFILCLTRVFVCGRESEGGKKLDFAEIVSQKKSINSSSFRIRNNMFCWLIFAHLIERQAVNTKLAIRRKVNILLSSQTTFLLNFLNFVVLHFWIGVGHDSVS